MNREFNATGWQVRAIGLGAMPLSIAGRPTEAEANNVIDAFIEAGGNFIDTANVYCLDDSDIGHNERLIHDALTRNGMDEKVIVATKGGMRRPKGDWVADARPEWLRASCERSLVALGGEAIALYQLHTPDPEVKLEESIGELIRLREEGKILHIGLSNVDAEQLALALHLTPIASVQNRCNPWFKRDFKNGVVDMCRVEGIAYIPYSPVGGHHGHARMRARDPMRRLSEKYGVSPYRIALAWLLGKGEHIIPIPGASKVSSARDCAQALGVQLETKDFDLIERLEDGETR